MPLKKFAATLTAAALVLTGPGGMISEAFAQVVVSPVGISPVAASGGAAGIAGSAVKILGGNLAGSSLPGAGLATALPSAAALNPAVSIAPNQAAPVQAAPGVVSAAGAITGVRAQASAAIAAGVTKSLPANSALKTIRSKSRAAEGRKAAALNTLFDSSKVREAGASAIAGGYSSLPSGLSRSGIKTVSGKDAKIGALSKKAETAKDAAGSDVLTIAAIGGALFAAALVFSKSFRHHMKRLWNVALGWIGFGVKKAETPEVLAQRIIDQLDEAKPVFNKKVAEASKLAAILSTQVRDQEAQKAELEKTIDALLSDDNEENDVLAAGMLKQSKILAQSIASTQEQAKLADASVEEIKAERTRFFYEKEQKLAEINALLARSKRAEMQAKIAELKGGFEVGDLGDNLDRLRDAVNEKEADAHGKKDSVDSSPEEMIKKAKDAMMGAEVKAELERRKAELKKKRDAAEDGKDAAGSDLVTIAAIGGTLFAAALVFSKSFRHHMKRLWNVALGWIGFGVKKAETPEVLAQRIIDQLDEAKPVFNKKVAEASKLAALLRTQLRDEQSRQAELEKTVDALLSDDNEENDVLAAGMLKQSKILAQSIASTAEQAKLADASVEEIKAERTRFFYEKEQKLAEINALLARSKRAEMQAKIAELKGGFEVGDLGDNLDRLRDAVNEKEADAHGKKDSVDSSPEEMIKKAKDAMMGAEVKAELERRKAELKKKREQG